MLFVHDLEAGMQLDSASRLLDAVEEEVSMWADSLTRGNSAMRDNRKLRNVHVFLAKLALHTVCQYIG